MNLWMPIIRGTGTQLINWTIRYVVPQDYTIISSGNLITRSTEASDHMRNLFIYKLKGEEQAIAHKIGFICGKFPFMYKS
jgi:hypothetical protein